MNWLVDLLIIAVLALFVSNGQRLGGFKGFCAFAIFVIAVVFSINYADWLVLKIENAFNVPTSILYVLCFTGIFAVSFFVLKLLGNYFFKMFRVTPLRFPDKIIGGAFGLLRGSLFVSLFLLMFVFIPEFQSNNNYIDKSRLAPAIRKAVPIAFDATSPFHPKSGTFVEEAIKGVLGGKASHYSKNLEQALFDRGKVAGVSINDDRVLNNLDKYFGKTPALAKGETKD